MSYLGRSNHRPRTCMYIVAMCDARWISKEFGYTYSSSRVLCRGFVCHAMVRPPAGWIVPAGTIIADVLSARHVIAKLAG